MSNTERLDETTEKAAPNSSHMVERAVERLTLRQVQVLRCVEQSIASRGAPPSQRELCTMLGMSSRRMVRDHLKALVRKGFLRLDDGVTRGMAVVVPSSEASLVARPLAKARAAQVEAPAAKVMG
jgi:repressor LexA